MIGVIAYTLALTLAIAGTTLGERIRQTYRWQAWLRSSYLRAIALGAGIVSMDAFWVWFERGSFREGTPTKVEASVVVIAPVIYALTWLMVVHAWGIVTREGRRQP